MAHPNSDTIIKAQRKVDAIDKRIDAVRVELVRFVGAFNDMSAHEWQRAWDSYPGLQGIERSLSLRRADAQDILGNLQWREARAAERKANRAYRTIRPAQCPACGNAIAA